jgi:hypothetical protein
MVEQQLAHDWPDTTVGVVVVVVGLGEVVWDPLEVDPLEVDEPVDD